MPLTRKQLTHIEARLREERERILGTLSASGADGDGDASSESADISNFPSDADDVATDVARAELQASVATRRSAEIAEIDAALERITTSPDTFGLDEDTGEAIAFERLDVIPWARASL